MVLVPLRVVGSTGKPIGSVKFEEARVLESAIWALGASSRVALPVPDASGG